MIVALGRSNPQVLTRLRWAWVMFLIALTSAPYLVNWLRTPAGYHYMWILPPGPEDSFAYLAWAQQAARGALLFKIKYTALPHSPFLFHPFFLVCGWLSALFSCEVGIIFFAAKEIGIAIFFLTFYRYIDYLGLSRVESIAASVLLGIAGGFGGIFALFGAATDSPLFATDLWIMDLTVFYAFLWSPLFPFSLTLILLSIYWTDRRTRDANHPDIWRAGLACGLLATIEPYFVPVVIAFAIIVIFARSRAKALGQSCRFLAAALPLAIYEVSISILNPIVSQHSRLGQMQSPPLAGYLLGFGVPFLLFAVSLMVDGGGYAKRYWQIVLWFFLCLGSAYLPVWFQRKLIFGAEVPLCIMSGITVGWIWRRFSSTLARRVTLFGLALLCLPLVAATPIYLLADLKRQVNDNIDNAYYESNDLISSLNVLKKISKPDDVVFAEMTTSRIIPAFSGNTTVWGHWAQSVDYKERRRWLEGLFHPASAWDDEARSRDFWGNGIDFILADKGFKQSLEQSPDQWRVILHDADKVFENPSVVIYRHRLSQ